MNAFCLLSTLHSPQRRFVDTKVCEHLSSYPPLSYMPPFQFNKIKPSFSFRLKFSFGAMSLNVLTALE